MYFNILSFVFLFYIFVFHFVYSVFCVLFLPLHIAVSLQFLYTFTDHCHRVETQLQ